MASALGPVLGGLLTDLSWHWVFLVNVPIGVAALLGGLRVLAAGALSGTCRVADVLGAAVLTAAIALVALGLGQGRRLGLGVGEVPRRPRSGGAAAGLVHGALRPPRLAGAAAAAVQVPRFQPVLVLQRAVRGRLRGHAAVDRAVVPGRVALVGGAHRLAISPARCCRRRWP
ncbi:hypothetical protein [Streptomyces sp. HF10]|uniref:hypothetical protein n=1 Tax=Streptomyces sp. HF10 TaxID=2692233 RepID=UPI00191548CC|nr:hypothetical protein [Streptomyces sp. HF10]